MRIRGCAFLSAKSSELRGSEQLSDYTEKIVELLDVHGGRLHGLLAKLTANHCAADELLQELFLRLLKSQSLSAAQSPEAYLFRSAINLAFDWRKQQHNLTEVSLHDRDVPARDSSPIDQMIVDETTTTVLEAMTGLPEQDRDLISLRFIQGESNEWIAGHLGSTPHVIRSRCSKAVARLRTLIEKRQAAITLREERT